MAARRSSLCNTRRLSSLRSRYASGAYLDVVPEGNVVLDQFGRRRGVRVIPGCIAPQVGADRDVIITGDDLPVTGGEVVARHEMTVVHSRGREKMMAIDHDEE